MSTTPDRQSSAPDRLSNHRYSFCCRLHMLFFPCHARAAYRHGHGDAHSHHLYGSTCRNGAGQDSRTEPGSMDRQTFVQLVHLADDVFGALRSASGHIPELSIGACLRIRLCRDQLLSDRAPIDPAGTSIVQQRSHVTETTNGEAIIELMLCIQLSRTSLRPVASFSIATARLVNATAGANSRVAGMVLHPHLASCLKTSGCPCHASVRIFCAYCLPARSGGGGALSAT